MKSNVDEDVPLLKASFNSATFFACPGNLNSPSSDKPLKIHENYYRLPSSTL